MRSVLLVDQEKSLSEILGDVLQELSYAVSVCANGGPSGSNARQMPRHFVIHSDAADGMPSPVDWITEECVSA
jgi:DNA-binding response OmpR family regulator